MERVVRGFPVQSGSLALALCWATLAVAASPPVALIDPQWQALTDSQGVAWMIDQQANVRINGGQSLLMSGGMLMVNSGQFSPTRVLMTPDGSEYVFEGSIASSNPFGGNGPALQTVRRIKIDLQSSTLRFVESFQNAGATPAQVNVTATSSLRSYIQGLVCGPSGTALDPGTGQPISAQSGSGSGRQFRAGVRSASFRLALPEHDCGVVLHVPASGLPGVLVYAPASATVKPSIDIQSSRTVRVSFTISVPAQSTVSVVWGLSQHAMPANLDATEMKNQLRVFEGREWLSDLPENVSKSIANYRRFNSGASLPIGPLLQPVLDLASHYRVERGKADVLVQDELTQLPGSVEGSSLSIGTSLGKTVVPLGEVALLCGGGGVERPMRTYLRNGEILVGRVEAKDLVLKAQPGVEVKLPPEKVNLLFLHAAGDDGKAGADAASIVETHEGQRLLLSGTEGQFHAATPWGALDFGLAEIDRLSIRREPQPVYRLMLKDGSSLSVLLQGEAPPLKSLRFGLVKLSTAGVRQLWSLKTPVAKQSDGEPPAASAEPFCRLIGENVLAGTIETPRVNIAMAGGTLGVPVARIQAAERNGDPRAGGPMNLQLTDGRRLTGLLANRTVAIRYHGKLWEVPGQHLVAISGGKKAAATESSPQPSAPRSAKAPTEEENSPAVEVPVMPEPPPAPPTRAPRPPVAPPADVDPFAPPAPAPPVAPPPADVDPFG